MKQSPVKVILFLAPLVVGLPFAMDIYVPAVPRIAYLFHVSAGEMQLTLTLFMLTAGLTQLIIGPLSDQYGRKKIIILTILLFAVGTTLCSTASSAPQLISYRSIQAIGACGMMVIAFAIVRDLYHGATSAQIYSYLNGIISFSPIFAPYIGSYLDVHYGWPATFLALLIIALAGLLSIVFGLTETLQPHNRISISRLTFSEYWAIARNPMFAIYAMATAFGLLYLYIFCSISPYIIIRLLHIPELHYGYYFCFMGISFLVGSFLCGYLVTRFGIYKSCLIGFVITLLGGLVMTIWYYVTGLTINNFIWPMLLIGIGGTFCLGAGSGGSMEPFSTQAGAASALGGAIRFSFSAILGSILITSKVSSTLPLALPALVLSVIGILIFLFNRERLQIVNE